MPDAGIAGIGIGHGVDHGQHLVPCGQVGQDDPTPQAVPVLRLGRGDEDRAVQSEVLLQVVADRPYAVCGKTGVIGIGVLGRGISFQVDGLYRKAVVSQQPCSQAVDTRQLAAIVGEPAQQHRTALRKVYDSRELFAVSFGFVCGNEERQPRLYGRGDLGGDQRRKGRPVSGTSLQVAVKDDSSACHPRLVGNIAFEKNRICRRIFPAAADDRVAENTFANSRYAVKPFPAFVDFLPDASRENDGSQKYLVFAVADDRRDGQLSVGREVDAGGDQAEQHAGGNQCIERRLLENGHHVRILKEVGRCDRQYNTKDNQCAKRTGIVHQIAGFLLSHLIYLPKLPS